MIIELKKRIERLEAASSAKKKRIERLETENQEQKE
jgi:hypothetical protein